MDEVEQALLRAGIDTLIDWVKSKWRERSRANTDSRQVASAEQSAAVTRLSRDREAALGGEVDEAALKLYEGEVRAVLSQVKIRKGNLNLLEVQRAQWGDALVPAVIVNGIQAENRELDALAARLQSLLQLILGDTLSASFAESLPAPFNNE